VGEELNGAVGRWLEGFGPTEFCRDGIGAWDVSFGTHYFAGKGCVDFFWLVSIFKFVLLAFCYYEWNSGDLRKNSTIVSVTMDWLEGRSYFSIVFIADAWICTTFSMHFPAPPLVVVVFVLRPSKRTGTPGAAAARWMAPRAKTGCMTESQKTMVAGRKGWNTECTMWDECEKDIEEAALWEVYNITEELEASYPDL